MNTIARCHRLGVRWVEITFFGRKRATGTVTRCGRVGNCFVRDSTLGWNLAGNRVHFSISIEFIVVFLI